MQVASVAPGRSAVLSLCRTFVGRPTLSKTSERLVRCQASQCRSASTGQTPETSFVVLERAVAARAGVDRELWQSGRFNAEVYPDLPIAGSWAEFFAKIASRYARSSMSKAVVIYSETPGRQAKVSKLADFINVSAASQEAGTERRGCRTRSGSGKTPGPNGSVPGPSSMPLM